VIDRIHQAAGFIAAKTDFTPEIAIVLGTSFDDYAHFNDIQATFDYRDIPGFPQSEHMMHAGKLIFAEFRGKRLAILQGRYHCYEGYSVAETIIPLRTMISLGIKKTILTNAAGGINDFYEPGDLMVISDHINLSSRNALTGENMDEFGPRYCDMSDAYDKDLRDLLFATGREIGIDLKEGVYAYMPGPSFETPAEIRALKVLGADAVGMSTVHETVGANHAGIKVAGLSCISNMAAGISKNPITNEEVIETLEKTKDVIRELLNNFIIKL